MGKIACSSPISHFAVKPEIRTERPPACHFAGRKDELRVLQHGLDGVAREGNGKDGVHLITAPQGFGKTELMRHFARTAEQRGEAIHLDIRPNRLSDANLIGIFKEKIESGTLPIIRKAWPDRLRVSGAEWIFRPDQNDCLEYLAAFNKRNNLKLPIIITIDEVQTIFGEAGRCLFSLHCGHDNAPVMVICNGLQHSRGVLAKCGISRFASHTALGLIDVGYCRKVIEITFRQFGLDTDAHEEEITRLAANTHGFAAHLQGQIAAIHRFYLDHRDAPVDFTEIGRGGAQSRNSYYEGRLASLSDTRMSSPLRRIASSMPDEGMGRGDIQKMLGGFPELDAQETLDAYIEKGCLRHIPLADTFDIPIPSFRAYLAGEASG